MRVDGIHYDQPRSAAAKELLELQARQKAIADEAAEAERKITFASRDVQRLTDELADAERRRLAGDDVAATVRRLEKDLAKAKDVAAQPWGARAQGARGALRDVEGQTQRFVADRWDELVAEDDEDAQAIKDRIDGLLTQLAEAYRARETLARRRGSLLGAFGAMSPGDVARSNLEAVVREAERVLEQGGEAAPVLRRDPRVAEPAEEVAA